MRIPYGIIHFSAIQLNLWSRYPLLTQIVLHVSYENGTIQMADMMAASKQIYISKSGVAFWTACGGLTTTYPSSLITH